METVPDRHWEAESESEVESKEEAKPSENISSENYLEQCLQLQVVSS